MSCVDNLQSELSKQAETQSRLNALLYSEQSRVDTLERHLQAFEQTSGSLQAQRSALDAEVRRFEELLASFGVQNRHAAVDLSHRLDQFYRLVDSIAPDGRVVMHRELMRQLLLKQSEIDRLRTSAPVLALEATVTKLTAEVANKNTKLADAELELRKLQLRLQSESERLHAVLDERDRLRARNRLLERLSGKTEEVSAEVERLQSIVKELKQQRVKREEPTLPPVKVGRLDSAFQKPSILAWLLEEATPDAADIAHGWIAMSGEGPWPLHLFDPVLRELGYAPWTMPDGEVEHIVVGQRGWSRDELRQQIDARRGETLRVYSQEMFVAMLATGRDPFDADDLDLLEAFAEGHPALQFLKDPDFGWPEPLSVRGQIITVNGGDLGVLESPLHILGYRVGASGLPIAQRHSVLNRCFEAEVLDFSDDSTPEYRRAWGRARSAQRLYRMAIHIKTLADGRVGKDPRKAQARQDWISDLKWLKGRYYSKFSQRFAWPQVSVAS